MEQWNSATLPQGTYRRQEVEPKVRARKLWSKMTRDVMTVSEALERAGTGAVMMGVLDCSRVVGFRVLNRDGQTVAMFNCSGIELAPPLVSDEGTSNSRLGGSVREDGDKANARPASDTPILPILSKSSSS
jgi:hypothetical protein